jgi:hypothetical protein
MRGPHAMGIDVGHHGVSCADGYAQLV